MNLTFVNNTSKNTITKNDKSSSKVTFNQVQSNKQLTQTNKIPYDAMRKFYSPEGHGGGGEETGEGKGTGGSETCVNLNNQFIKFKNSKNCENFKKLLQEFSNCYYGDYRGVVQPSDWNKMLRQAGLDTFLYNFQKAIGPIKDGIKDLMVTMKTDTDNNLTDTYDWDTMKDYLKAEKLKIDNLKVKSGSIQETSYKINKEYLINKYYNLVHSGDFSFANSIDDNNFKIVDCLKNAYSGLGSGYYTKQELKGFMDAAKTAYDESEYNRALIQNVYNNYDAVYKRTLTAYNDAKKSLEDIKAKGPNANADDQTTAEQHVTETKGFFSSASDQRNLSSKKLEEAKSKREEKLNTYNIATNDYDNNDIELVKLICYEILPIDIPEPQAATSTEAEPQAKPENPYKNYDRMFSIHDRKSENKYAIYNNKYALIIEPIIISVINASPNYRRFCDVCYYISWNIHYKKKPSEIEKAIKYFFITDTTNYFETDETKKNIKTILRYKNIFNYNDSTINTIFSNVTDSSDATN